jgi:hypothetical protein
MVAAQVATFSFKGKKTGLTYPVSGYISDVVGALILWAKQGTAAATSQPHLTFNEAVTLYDISIPTGLTASTSLVLQVNGVLQPFVFSAVNQLNTSAGRTPISVGIAALAQIDFVQG